MVGSAGKLVRLSFRCTRAYILYYSDVIYINGLLVFFSCFLSYLYAHTNTSTLCGRFGLYRTGTAVRVVDEKNIYTEKIRWADHYYHY